MRGQYYLHMLEVTGLAGPGPAADRAEAAVRPLEAAVPPQVLLLPVLQLLQDLQPGSQSQLSIAPWQLHQSQASITCPPCPPGSACSRCAPASAARNGQSWSQLTACPPITAQYCGVVTNHSSVLAGVVTNESPVLPEAGQQLVAGVTPLLCVPRPRPAP